jgi:hypothetical protein
MLSTGILLAFVRTYEPFFILIIKKFLYSLFGILVEDESEGVKTQPLSAFLASSLNVELVHVILKGIKKFSNIKMEHPEEMDLDLNEDEREEINEQLEKESYELMRICRINRIKIKDPAKWNSAKNDDFIEDCYIDSFLENNDA